MDWSLTTADASLTVSLSGFTDILPKLLRLLLAATEQDFSQNRFEVLRAKKVQSLSNEQFENGFNYACRVLKPLVLEMPVFSTEHQLQALEALTFQQFTSFTAKLLHDPNQPGSSSSQEQKRAATV